MHEIIRVKNVSYDRYEELLMRRDVYAYFSVREIGPAIDYTPIIKR